MGIFLWLASIGLALWLFLRALQLLASTRFLLATDLQKVTRTPVAAESVPEWVRRLAEPSIAELAALGFETAGWFETDGIVRHRSGPSWNLLLRDANGTVWAELDAMGSGDGLRPVSLSFVTLLADGGSVVTVSGTAWAIVGEAEGIELVDAQAFTTEEHLARHRAHLSQLAPPRVMRESSVDEVIAEGNRFVKSLLRGLDDRHELVANGDGTYRLTLPAAVRWALRVRRGYRKARPFLLERARRVGDEPLPLEYELAAFRRMRDRAPRPPSRREALSLLVLSGALFAAVLLPFLPLRTIGLVAAVLLFHEGGHWVAMRAFGYRDMRVFFLPFFGAAVAASGTSASAGQRAVVSLAGPLPGLLLGALLLAWLPPVPLAFDWRIELGWLLVVLNGLNLLPVSPLDGGQLVNELLFSRHPSAEALFRGVSAVALIAAGWFIDERILVGLGLLGLLVLPATWRRARLVAALRRTAPDPADEARFLPAALAWLRDHAASVPMNQRLQLVESVARIGALEAPSVRTSAAVLACWLAAIGAVPGIVWFQQNRAFEGRAWALDADPDADWHPASVLGDDEDLDGYDEAPAGSDDDPVLLDEPLDEATDAEEAALVPFDDTPTSRR